MNEFHGDRIKTACEFIGCTLEELAKMIDIDYNQLLSIKNSVLPFTIEVAQKICKSLHLPLTFFVAHDPIFAESQLTFHTLRGVPLMRKRQISVEYSLLAAMVSHIMRSAYIKSCTEWIDFLAPRCNLANVDIEHLA